MGLNELGRIIGKFTGRTGIPVALTNSLDHPVELHLTPEEFVHLAKPHLTDLLTGDEHHALRLTAELVNLVSQKVIGRGPSRDGDINEFASAMHVVQNMILSQAASRAFPDKYRLMGESL